MASQQGTDVEGGRDPLSRVVLAISSFQSDAAVIALLRAVFRDSVCPFQAVVVVDSLSSGAIEAAAHENGWPVRLFSASYNLGAAGNHAKRMEIAVEYDAEWCYAVNADGEVNLEAIREMVRSGTVASDIGAVYPKRIRPNRGDSWEQPRLNFLPLSSRIRSDRTNGDREVLWSSSNGALYRLEPVKSGIVIWVDFWMGWEDLSYSWLLWKNGWRQIICARAVFVDHYEHRSVRLLGRTIYIHDKNPWISYYTIRNLALFVERSESGLKGWLVVLLRFAQEVTLATLFKDRKLKRIRILSWGLLDGLRGRTGMVTSPSQD